MCAMDPIMSALRMRCNYDMVQVTPHIEELMCYMDHQPVPGDDVSPPSVSTPYVLFKFLARALHR